MQRFGRRYNIAADRPAASCIQRPRVSRDFKTRNKRKLVIVGVPKESYPGERRVGLVPKVVPSLVKAGFEVVVETGAGMEAGYPDAHYVEKGAKVLTDRAAVFSAADVVVQVL